jgi:antitoxin (DNA-binding transcriptional repressor) of toxin-antitoxin stability system
MTELDRRPAAVLREVREGEVAILSKHKRAVAMIVPLDDELELVLRDPTQAEGMAELIDAFKERARARWSSAVMHGRWYGRAYRRYRRPRRERQGDGPSSHALRDRRSG